MKVGVRVAQAEDVDQAGQDEAANDQADDDDQGVVSGILLRVRIGWFNYGSVLG